MNDQVSITISEMLAKAAIALQSVVQQYGPDAINLGLVVYRIEGLKIVAVGLLLVLFFIIVSSLFFKHRHFLFEKVCVQKESSYSSARYEYPNQTQATIATTILAFSFFISLQGLVNLFNFYAWAAALGYPEVLIAYKTLVSSGLM